MEEFLKGWDEYHNNPECEYIIKKVHPILMPALFELTEKVYHDIIKKELAAKKQQQQQPQQDQQQIEPETTLTNPEAIPTTDATAPEDVPIITTEAPTITTSSPTNTSVEDGATAVSIEIPPETTEGQAPTPLPPPPPKKEPKFNPLAFLANRLKELRRAAKLAECAMIPALDYMVSIMGNNQRLPWWQEPDEDDTDKDAKEQQWKRDIEFYFIQEANKTAAMNPLRFLLHNNRIIVTYSDDSQEEIGEYYFIDVDRAETKFGREFLRKMADDHGFLFNNNDDNNENDNTTSNTNNNKNATDIVVYTSNKNTAICPWSNKKPIGYFTFTMFEPDFIKEFLRVLRVVSRGYVFCLPRSTRSTPIPVLPILDEQQHDRFYTYSFIATQRYNLSDLCNERGFDNGRRLLSRTEQLYLNRTRASIKDYLRTVGWNVEIDFRDLTDYYVSRGQGFATDRPGNPFMIRTLSKINRGVESLSRPNTATTISTIKTTYSWRNETDRRPMQEILSEFELDFWVWNNQSLEEPEEFFVHEEEEEEHAEEEQRNEETEEYVQQQQQQQQQHYMDQHYGGEMDQGATEEEEDMLEDPELENA